MRALFTTQPGHGHLTPFLPYAQALRDSGHEVRFASAAAFAPQIERHSFGCYPIGYDFTWDRAAQFFPEIAQAAVERRDMEFAVFEVGWKRWNPQAARDLNARPGSANWC
jgi:UDP:flavonoid glycosyltransferase YjiC (YdhE family)